MQALLVTLGTGAALIGLAGLGMARIRSLDGDFRQRLLAREMLGAVRRSREGMSLSALWSGSVVPYFIGLYGDLPLAERRARANHALATIRRELSSDDFLLLQQDYCSGLPEFREQLQLA